MIFLELTDIDYFSDRIKIIILVYELIGKRSATCYSQINQFAPKSITYVCNSYAWQLGDWKNVDGEDQENCHNHNRCF